MSSVASESMILDELVEMANIKWIVATPLVVCEVAYDVPSKNCSICRRLKFLHFLVIGLLFSDSAE